MVMNALSPESDSQPVVLVCLKDSIGRLEPHETIALSELTRARIREMASCPFKPLLVRNREKLLSPELLSVRDLIGKRLIVCSATKSLIQEKMEMQNLQLSNLEAFGSQEFHIAGPKKEQAYFDLAPLLDAEYTNQISPSLFRSKLCAGILRLADALENEYPDRLPDFDSLRIRNAFEEHKIRSLTDLKSLEPFQIMRMRNFGQKSLMDVFISLMALSKPSHLIEPGASQHTIEPHKV